MSKIGLDDLNHNRAIWEVTVEEPQRSSHKRKPHSEGVERKPLLIEVATVEALVVAPKTEFQEHMLPLYVEIHKPLNIDQNRLPALINQHVIRPKFSMNKPEDRARKYICS